jgi:methylmalonyl-CoA mutase, N-terminal domain
MEEKILAIMEEVERYGGAVKAIEDGWLQMRIAHRALERKRNIDSGDFPVVGLNCYAQSAQKAQPGETFRLDPESRARVLAKYRDVLESRDAGRVAGALRRLEEAAAGDGENLMPWLIECAHAYATVGEMVERLTHVWGEFREPVRL